MDILHIICFLILNYGSIYFAASFTPHMEEVRDVDDESWGYVEVRPGAHTFWWMYYTTHPDGYQNRPWIIWLQGGPGLSGTALGNFMEIGPLDKDLMPRNSTWVSEASVMFIDNPAGVGFSYVEDDDLIPTTQEGITDDLVSFIRVFLQHYPAFRMRPLMLFGQSFGGKYVTHLGYTLTQLRQSGDLDINLQTIGIGNGFVSPEDFMKNVGPFLYQAGLVDDLQRDGINERMDKVVSLVREARYVEAVIAEGAAMRQAFKFIPGLDFYNILDFHSVPQQDQANPNKRQIQDHTGSFMRMFGSIYDVDLTPLMEGSVRDKLQIIPANVTWNGNPRKVYIKQISHLMKSTVYTVEWLLENSNVLVAVYEGQLDLACMTSGAMSWVSKLKWRGHDHFYEAKRDFQLNPFTRKPETRIKSHNQLKFYWNLNAGHTVPTDVPGAAIRMLQRIMRNQDQ